MPDENKLTRLREVGFQILPTCATCEHFVWRGAGPFGYCSPETEVTRIEFVREATT